MKIICLIIGHKWFDLGSHFYHKEFMYNQKTCLRCGKSKKKKLKLVGFLTGIDLSKPVKWESYYFGD